MDNVKLIQKMYQFTQLLFVYCIWPMRKVLIIIVNIIINIDLYLEGEQELDLAIKRAIK
jgi:hypothetical protein